MNIFLVSKIAKNGSPTVSRYIYAKNSEEATSIYREELGIPSEIAIVTNTIFTSGMLLANRDTPTRVRNGIHIFSSLPRNL